MKDKTEEIFKAIWDEREYQKAKWGDDTNKSIGDFLVFIDCYLNKAKDNYTDINHSEHPLHTIRKIATLCVAAMERHGVRARDLADLNKYNKQTNDLL